MGESGESARKRGREAAREGREGRGMNGGGCVSGKGRGDGGTKCIEGRGESPQRGWGENSLSNTPTERRRDESALRGGEGDD